MTVSHPSFRGFVEFARKNSNLVSEADSVVEFIVLLSERAILSGDDHVYYDPYLVVQLVSGARGACFLHPGDIKETDFDLCIGKSVLDVVEIAPLPLGIALLDAYFSLLNPKLGITPKHVYTINGLGAEKSQKRARTIVQLAEIKKETKILMIGVISDIVREILSLNAQVKLADFLLAGTKIHGVDVMSNAEPFLGWADTIIMTGNVLKTETLENLIGQIKRLNKKLIVYAMTGAHLAPYYIGLGAEAVTAEVFPYYWYAHIPSMMEIYKDDQENA